ncbi:SAM-dependent methyltransferase [Nocardia alba]|uniref:Cyclopropane-fatty-acyl-phospholipid synthase n=1 Tax=Nocardia alba TaxID=225051 RepID=A0A4V2PBG8_9NOCA|nr:cyclopropane-fatty-acyl-phospholipid synthase family protein [Nocardia alba]TCJ97365.1 cyclopropane-fatty-acyl-phospholipid synthase [Nocardia alba]
MVPSTAPANSEESTGSASILLDGFERLTGTRARFGLRLWDGSRAGRTDAPTALLGSPNALRRMILRPDDLGLARAFVTGELRVEGSVTEFLQAGALTADDADWAQGLWRDLPVRVRGVLSLAAWALRAGRAWRPLPHPAVELARWRLRSGAQAVRHHYDLGDDFYRLILGPSMVYSSAYWPDLAQPDDLEAAQAAKLDQICRKLRLGPGTTLLDIGCGWGSLLVHAAEHYGTRSVGVTLSCDEAEYTRRRVEAAGLGDRISIRLGNAVDVTDGQFDAIAGIAVSQHLNRRQQRRYAQMLHDLLRPGGRALSHDVCVSETGRKYQDSPFLRRYIFPELNLRSLGESVISFERAGLEVVEVESLRRHYAPTYDAWLANLEANWDAAVRAVGVEKTRAWQLFLATGSAGCHLGWTGANHVLLARPESAVTR